MLVWSHHWIIQEVQWFQIKGKHIFIKILTIYSSSLSVMFAQRATPDADHKKNRKIHKLGNRKEDDFEIVYELFLSIWMFYFM